MGTDEADEAREVMKPVVAAADKGSCHAVHGEMQSSTASPRLWQWPPLMQSQSSTASPLWPPLVEIENARDCATDALGDAPEDVPATEGCLNSLEDALAEIEVASSRPEGEGFTEAPVVSDSTVRSVEDMFDWPKHYMRSINEAWGGKSDSPLQFCCAETAFAEALRAKTFSMSYGGIDAPGCALSMLCGHNEAITQSPTRPKILYNFENNLACQYELRNAPHSCCCLFGDLSSLFPPQIHSTIAKMQAEGHEITLSDLIPVIRAGNATAPTAFCLIHQRQCRIIKHQFMTRAQCAPHGFRIANRRREMTPSQSLQ